MCTRTALPPTLRSTTDTVIRLDSGLPDKKEAVSEETADACGVADDAEEVRVPGLDRL